MKQDLSLSLCLFITLLASCGGEESTVPDPIDPVDPVAAQIQRGITVYGQNCAACHGAMGQGTNLGPPLVGPGALPRQPRSGALRNVEFVTVHDVFVWAKANMPPTAPGSISDADMLAVLAFDLDANGVQLDGLLDVEAARSIVLNPEE